MRKVYRGSKFIILCTIVIVIFACCMVGNINSIKQSYSELNNSDTKNLVYVMPKDVSKWNEGTEERIEFFNKLILNKDIIIKVLCSSNCGFQSDESIGIYFNGQFKNNYNILEGRFFSKEDFSSSDKTAVIGKNILEKCIVENGKKYILKNDEKFEVIGILGKEKLTTKYDNYIMFKLNDLISDIGSVEGCEWKVDSFVYSSSELDNMIQENSSTLYGQKLTSDEIGTPLSRSLEENRDVVVSFELIIIVLILSLVQAVIYWCEDLKLEIGIRKNYGATDGNIVSMILIRYLIISSTSMIISILPIYVVQDKINFLQCKINFEVILIVAISVILLSIIPSILVIHILKRNTIDEMLKEGGR